MEILGNYVRDENGEFYLVYFEKPDGDGKYQPEFEKIKEIENDENIKNKIKESLKYLVDTDFKFLVGYEPKVAEDLEVIRAKRNEARAFVRDNNDTKRI